MVFLGQGPDGLGQQDKALHRQGQFAGLGAEEAAGEADDVPQVQLLEEGIGLGADFLALNVALQAAAFVLEMKEGGLAELPDQDQAAGQAEGLAQGLEVVMAGSAIPGQDLGDAVLRVKVLGNGSMPACRRAWIFSRRCRIMVESSDIIDPHRDAGAGGPPRATIRTLPLGKVGQWNILSGGFESRC